MFRLPDTVTLALDTLEAAGYEAYAVGGCVRDLCRGVVPHDYDITTSATPDEIEAVFCGFRLIETGIKHGTVTVLIDGEPLEITTYRTDGEYLDRRHPSNVTFSRDIDDDLSRRDFTVNAMAYSPRRGLRDPFDGRGDLCRRVIRCVGDPDTRFSEDGLRIMRAVRFASCLGFDIDMATSESIHKNRRLLADISAERILSELRRLVVGENACRILTEYGDLIGGIMPEAADDGYTGRVRGIRDTEADEVLRLAVILGGEDAVCALVRLKPDGKLLDGIGRALSLAKDGIGLDPISLRRALRHAGYDDVIRAVRLRAYYGAIAGVDADGAISLLCAMRECGECVTPRQLAISGRDLIALGVPEGEAVGEMLERLLGLVVEEKLENESGALLDAARAIKAASVGD